MKNIINRFTQKKRAFQNLALSVCFLFCILGHSQLENPLVGRYTASDGLPNDNVYAITQDRQGFLWVGTENGLARYDGVGFLTFQHDHTNPHSISSDDILCMITDHEGQIWIGAFGGGLNKLDPQEKRFQRFEHDPGDAKSVSHSNINTLFEDSKSRLWVGTDGGGLNLYHPETQDFTHYKFGPENQIHPNNQILSIEENYNGKLWVGSQKGLFILDPETGEWEPFQSLWESDINLATARITALYQDHTTRDLWIGTYQGVYRYIQNSNLPKPIIYKSENGDQFGLSDNQVNVLFKDQLGALWAGVGSDGLNRFSLDKDSFVHWRHQSLEENHYRDIRTIYQDRTGIIWVGDRGQGLMKIDRKPAKYLVYRQGKGAYGLSHPLVRCIVTDQNGNLWAGTEDGLNYINRLKQTVSRYHYVEGVPESLPSDKVTALAWYNRQLVVGTAGGLCRMENGQFIPFHQEQNQQDHMLNTAITGLIQDGSSGLWIGGEQGLTWFNGEGFTYFLPEPGSRKAMSGKHVTALALDDKQDLWIGVQGEGLSHHSPGSQKFEHFRADPNDPQSLGNNTVYDIHCFLDFIWVASPGGLNRMNRSTQQFLKYSKKSGLPGNTVYAIADDGRDELWLSTNHGLCRMNPFQETFRNYDVVDGLQGNRFTPGSVFQTSENELFFGGVNGLNTFYPKHVKDNPFAPKVAISRVQVPTMSENLDYSNKPGLELTHHDKVIHFEFRALDFTLPEKNQFRVMMSPMDRDWTTPGAREITYVSLPPGPYVFRVKAANNDGVWSNEDAEFHIRIHPPFYRTWTAYALYFLLILTAVLGAVKSFRLREERKNKKRLEENSAQIKEEADRAKQVFLAHMSHELRTPLTAVIGYTELVEEEISDFEILQQQQIRPDLEKIKASAYYQLSLVSNLLELSNLEAGNTQLSLTTFDIAVEIQAMLPHFEAQLTENRNSFKLRIPEEIGTIKTDRIKLMEILMNLLINANRYTRDGEITLLIRRLKTFSGSTGKEQEAITFAVKDTGQGMSEKELGQILDGLRNPLGRRKTIGPGLGLELCYKFARMMSGEIDFHSKKGQGTRVTLRLPAELDEKTLPT